MVSPACEIKEGAGSYQSTDGGFNATPAATVTIHLIDSSAKSWQLECLSTDETSSAATVNAGLTSNVPARTVTLTAPAAGKAYRFRSTVDGGGRPSLSTTFCVYTLINGNRVVALEETVEGGSFGWLGSFNTLVRSGGGGVSPTGTGVPKVVSGVTQAAASKIVDADIDAAAAIAVSKLAAGASNGYLLMKYSGSTQWAHLVDVNVSASAAIAGTKIAPDFGAQRIITTGGVTLGATPASAGDVRLKKDFTILGRNSGNTKNLWLFDYTDADALYIGSDRNTTLANQVTTLGLYAAGAVAVGISGSTGLYVQSGEVDVFVNQNFAVFGGQGNASYGGGVGVVFVGDANTGSSSNPSNGSILESSKGTLKHRASTGRNGILTLDSDGANLVDILAAFATPTAVGTSVCTVGTSFFVTRAVKCTGVRFYWATASKQIKAQLWSGISSVGSVTATTSGTGVFSFSFASPVTLSPNALYTVSCWQTDGLNYSKSTLSTADVYLPRRPYQAGGGVLMVAQATLYSLGDAKPTSTAASEAYAVEPILEYS